MTEAHDRRRTTSGRVGGCWSSVYGRLPSVVAALSLALLLGGRPEPSASALTQQPTPAATPDVRPAGSEVREHAFFSPALGETMSYLVYLPPGYATAARRYPTLFMLHGVAGDSREWVDIGIPEAADLLIEAGEIEPLLIVFPNADASYYVNWAASGRRWQDYLVQDVLASVDGAYRTVPRPESRAVGGLSMGGDGALQLAMRFPNLFGIAGAHSPSTRLLFEVNVPTELYGNEAYFRAHNPFWLAQADPGAEQVRIWIDVGDQDPWRFNARAIHAALEARGIDHEFRLQPGVHDADYWIGHAHDYLRFYDGALAHS